MAPNFTLHVTPHQTLTLSDLLERPVILAFYPADWSPVCGDQMALCNDILPEFRKFGAELLGVSVDRAWCHGASIDEQLAQKGLTKVEKDADVYVGYRATVELEKSMDLWSIGSGGWGDRSVQGQTSTIPVGMLLVDLYDRQESS